MSNIYLNTVVAGVDTFTPGQIDTIANLAIRCPYSAGDAVYIARALYAQYDNTIFFDDLAICTVTSSGDYRMLMVSENKKDTTTQQDYIIVYPNPAKNILKVFYSSTNNATITFELTDITGQPVMSTQVPNMVTVELNVSSLASSLYLWRGLNGKLVIQSGKVSIQK